ncbi:solute carrier family 25 member 47 isoform X2 [Papio anubis]|uniref:solute carrier family 25 member 47 isoform X2 n=1 Tax=Papio anubis TaxID=9555 RepID=UPI0004F1EED9|nr:solute carrier family 25 member 47 isoform X2 [Papio anubis]
MDFVAGAIGGNRQDGVCGVAVGYPLDTVKVWQQQPPNHPKAPAPIHGQKTFQNAKQTHPFPAQMPSVAPQSPWDCQSHLLASAPQVRIQTEPKYTGIWHCIRDTYHRERVWGFYRGLSLPVCTVSLVSSVSFGTYRHCLAHICQLRYGSPDAKPSKADIALSGYASGLVRVFLTSPTEVAKVRLQTQTQAQKQQRRLSASGPSAVPPVCPAPPACPEPKYRGPLHCLATVAREEGLRGLYKGSSALLLRDGHSFATYFLSYAILCERLSPAGHSQPDVLGVLVAGGCAGVLAWAVATPMDVIKSRLQADGQGQRRYRGLLHCMVTSVREEGPRVLFKGLVLNCCRAFPVNMVVFVAYEAVLRLTQGLLT